MLLVPAVAEKVFQFKKQRGPLLYKGIKQKLVIHYELLFLYIQKSPIDSAT